MVEFALPANGRLSQRDRGGSRRQRLVHRKRHEQGRTHHAGRRHHRVRDPHGQQRGLRHTAGPDGNLWFVENSANKIGRITTAGVVTEFAVPTANSRPLGDHGRPGRQSLVHGANRQQDRTNHDRRASSPSFRFRPPAARPSASRPGRTATLVHRDRRQQDRPNHSGRRRDGVRHADADQLSPFDRRGTRRQPLVPGRGSPPTRSGASRRPA